MPDLQQLSVVRLGTTVTLTNVPQWQVEFQVCDSTTGALLRDFTGIQNPPFVFPQVFASFAAADQNTLVSQWVMDLIRTKAPDLF
jgi:hypothetical protein